jgi:rSAM/selenodomain-associated transferase 2
MVSLSVVIPALNEAGGIPATLSALRPLRAAGQEIIVVDGGSSDATAALAEQAGARVIRGPRGRARQMNAGAGVARGDVLWFLHADTLAPAGAMEAIVRALETSPWGRFDVRLSGGHPLLRWVEAMMNHRSRLTGIATGDQGLFMRRELFEQVGGFPDLPLMEDIAISKRLKRIAPPACLSERLLTSSRRWEQRGVSRTIVLMWWLRLAYFLGVSPRRLAEWYR